MLRHVLSQTRRICARTFSTGNNQLVQTEITADRVAFVRLNNAPVNIMTMDLLKTFTETLHGLREKEGVSALILSSTQRVFSAGLDITQMHKPQHEPFHAYIKAVQDVFVELYNYPKPVIAAIGGAAPAGGCWLALQCDYRIMTNTVPNAVIGLNETKLGIVAPMYFQEPLIRTVGFRHADRLLQLGSLVKPDEALKLGLVDMLHAEPEAAALQVAKEWMAIPTAARTNTKSALRKDLVDHLERTREYQTKSFWSQVQHPNVQNEVSRYLASLKKK